MSILILSSLTLSASSSTGESIIPNDIDRDRGGVCVKATWGENNELSKVNCVYTDSVNSSESNLPSEEENNEEIEDADKILKIFSLHDQTLIITKKMQDHSDRNLELKNSGRASEMEPYPGQGWNIIIDISEHETDFGGVILSKTGDYVRNDFKEVTNDSDYSVALTNKDDDTIGLYSYINGSLETIKDDPSMVYTDSSGFLNLHWYQNNKTNRPSGEPSVLRYYPNSDQLELKLWGENGVITRDDGPVQINYYESGQVKYVSYYKDNKLNRTDGPAQISYDESGNRTVIWFYINGVRTTNLADWTAAGGDPDKWEVL